MKPTAAERKAKAAEDRAKNIEALRRVDWRSLNAEPLAYDLRSHLNADHGVSKVRYVGVEDFIDLLIAHDLMHRDHLFVKDSGEQEKATE